MNEQLEVDGLRRSYGGGVAPDGLSFTVAPGRMFGSFGSNGAGETTTMRIILAIERRTGRDSLRREPVSERSRLRFGYMPEQRGLYPRIRAATNLPTCRACTASTMRRRSRRPTSGWAAGWGWRSGRRCDWTSCPTGTSSGCTSLATAIPLRAGLDSAGVPPERINRVLTPTPLPIRAIDPAPEDGGSRDAAYLGSFVLYMALLTYGGWITTGVLEEKSSRIGEVVLAAVRPTQLLVGGRCSASASSGSPSSRWWARPGWWRPPLQGAPTSCDRRSPARWRSV